MRQLLIIAGLFGLACPNGVPLLVLASQDAQLDREQVSRHTTDGQTAMHSLRIVRCSSTHKPCDPVAFASSEETFVGARAPGDFSRAVGQLIRPTPQSLCVRLQI